MKIQKASLSTVSPDDISLVLRELEGANYPVPLGFLTEKVAFGKTEGQRSQALKKYDPSAKFEVGELIYKEYDETLNIGSKAAQHFKGAVALEVVNKTYFQDFDCEMLEVDYSGGGLFRKYIDYMKKTKTQVLLPSNYGRQNIEPELLPKEADPRLNELPMTESEIKKLAKNLRSELAKHPDVFGWQDFFQLKSKRLEINPSTIAAIDNYLADTGKSASAEELVEKFLEVPPANDLFALYCLSLNSLLEKKFKKDFVLVSEEKWGRWHLKNIVNTLPENKPISASPAQIPDLVAIDKPEMSTVSSFPIKIYLGWREILSGAVKIPRSLSKELIGAREYLFTETDTGKQYTLYYYPSGSFFIGLDEFYKQQDVPQGASLTLEKASETVFNFWVKKSKKKFSFPRLTYESSGDRFSLAPEDAFSYAEPNKIIYLEREALSHLFELYEQRNELNLKDLLLLVFKDPLLSSSSQSMHFLRAYHLVDLLKQTTQEDVELVLLNSPEFVKSEKKKGIFFYEEPAPIEEAPAIEQIAAEPVEPEAAGLPEAEAAGAPEERAEAAGEEKAGPEPAPPEPGIQAAEPSKEKVAKKKKKIRPEGEKLPRAKKSERRVIEEKIEEEESVQEALSAIKEVEEEGEEHALSERQEEFKTVQKEQPKFGFFAEVLKSALKKKDQPQPKKDEEEKEEK